MERPSRRNREEKEEGGGGEGGRRRRDRGVEGLCYQKVPADRHRRQPREH